MLRDEFSRRLGSCETGAGVYRTMLVTALVFSASLSYIKATIILASLNKDYMYLNCRFQFSSSDLCLTRTPFVFAESRTRETEVKIQSNT